MHVCRLPGGILKPYKLHKKQPKEEHEMIKKRIVVCFLCIIAFPFLNCEDSSPTKATDPNPTFSMASANVTCSNDTPCVLFYVTPNADVILVKVEIKPPGGDSFTRNLYSGTFNKNATFALQDEGTAFAKENGIWTFTFTGNKATGSKKSFTVTATLNVSD